MISAVSSPNANVGLTIEAISRRPALALASSPTPSHREPRRVIEPRFRLAKDAAQHAFVWRCVQHIGSVSAPKLRVYLRIPARSRVRTFATLACRKFLDASAVVRWWRNGSSAVGRLRAPPWQARYGRVV